MQIADILLGKNAFSTECSINPVKAINASIVDRLIKRSAAERVRKVVWTVCYASGISSM
uniref:Uncharacterized protein n=1 Tax=Klebsiella pneumoniae TaxID=573 RepID=A0A8B0SYM3_KLEPN|nr:hypothetical protein [Klebsiella pneumoniae]